MKNLLREELNLKSTKHKEIDPHSEEDWDEYEVTNGDEFYMLGITEDNDTFVSIGEAIIKNNNMDIKIVKTNNNDIKDVKFQVSNDAKREINSKQITWSNINLKKNYKTSIIARPNMFFDNKNKIHEKVRIDMYNKVRTSQDRMTNIENEMNDIEKNVIKLKSNIKSKNDFPLSSHLDFNEGEFIVLRTKEVDKNINVEIVMTTLKKTDEKGGHYLYNVENDQKVIYLQKNLEKLQKNQYLLLKSKNDENTHTYITNDIEKYEMFVDNIIESVNNKVEEKVKTLRERYQKLLDKLNEQREKTEFFRKKYMNFNFHETVKVLDDLKNS